MQSASRAAPTGCSRRARGRRQASRTCSLNASTNTSSSGLLSSANCTAAAITRSRLLDMLVLLSISRPIVAGASAVEKKLKLLRIVVFVDEEVVLLEPGHRRAAAIFDRRVDDDEIRLRREGRALLWRRGTAPPQCATAITERISSVDGMASEAEERAHRDVARSLSSVYARRRRRRGRHASDASANQADERQGFDAVRDSSVRSAVNRALDAVGAGASTRGAGGAGCSRRRCDASASRPLVTRGRIAVDARRDRPSACPRSSARSVDASARARSAAPPGGAPDPSDR